LIVINPDFFVVKCLMTHVLQAEHDLFNERKADLALARETEIMKHVDDWEVGKNVYSTRWTKPTGGR
jgi:GRIM-19 protein